MQIYTGSYSGNGTSQSITGVGFAPDAVLIRSAAADALVCSTIEIEGNTFDIQGLEDSTTSITGLDADGFTVGAHTDVNDSGVTFYYCVLRDNGQTDFETVTYTGNGADNRDITGVGFQPDVVWIFGADSYSHYWIDAKGGDNAAELLAASPWQANTIQSVGADGFQIGSATDINYTSEVYIALCFKAVCVDTGTYTGNATDDRDISITAGFLPLFVSTIGAGSYVSYRFGTTGDNSWNAQDAVAANIIQSFSTGSFQIGNNGLINYSAEEYHFFCLKGTAAAGGGLEMEIAMHHYKMMRD